MRAWPIFAASLALGAAFAFGCAGSMGVRGGIAAAPLYPWERAWLVDGDAASAEELLTARLESEPGDGEARFLLADLLDATGRPAMAAAHYFRLLDLGRADGRFAEVATAAAMALVAARDRIPDFSARFAVWADSSLEAPGALPAEAAYELRNLRFAVALHRGDDARKRASALEATGCLVRWDVLGSFGPRGYDAFDAVGEDEPWFGGGTWPAFARLGPGRGEVAVRTVEAGRCSVSASHPESRAPGLGLARTVVALDKSGTVLFRLEADAAVRVLAGGVEIFSADRRARWLPRYVWFAAELPAGNTEISVAVARSDLGPVFSLAAVRADGGSPLLGHGPRILPSEPGGAGRGTVRSAVLRGAPEPTTATAALARFRVAVWRRDDATARGGIARLASFGASRSPVALAAAAQSELADPDQPIDVAFEAARGLYAEALEGEPKLWEARLHLARAAEGEGRSQEALALVAAGGAATPEEPSVAQRLAEMRLESGRAVEARAEARRLGSLVPGSCAALAIDLAASRGDSAPGSRIRAAGALSGCDRASDALAIALFEAGDFAAARAEYARLRAREPSDPGLCDAGARAARAAGDLPGEIAARRDALALAPNDVGRRLALADALAASGLGDEARGVLARGLERDTPGAQRLVAALSALDGRASYAPYRVDGLAAVAAFNAENPSYGTGAVWVLDRTVNLVARDGSRVELTHQISQLMSPEALARHGEVDMPADAIVLTARAIKADGSVRGVERIEGKPSLSVPDLEVGDFVEVEYVRRVPPSTAFPGGFDTERFFFGDREDAFHRSEMVLVSPEGMSLELDPRGGVAQPSQRVFGGSRALSWRVRGARPIAEEPLEPDAAQRLPSIRVASGASREALCGYIRDLLADGQRISPEIDALAAGTVDGIPAEAVGRRLAALYRWTLDNVAEDGDFESPVSHLVARRQGSRARVFEALARSLGISSRLAFVRPARADDTAGALPDPLGLGGVAVLAGGSWLVFEEDAAPFGYLSPELRHRPALLPDRCEEVRTGGGSTPLDARDVAITIRIAANGDAGATVSEVLSGADAIGWRSAMRGMTDPERERAFAEGYVSEAWPGAAVSHLEFVRLDDPDSPLEIFYELAVSGFARGVEGSMRAALPFPRNLLRDIGGRAARTAPAVISTYQTEGVRITVIPPEGFSVTTAAGSELVDSPFGRAARTIRGDGEGIEVASEFRLEAGRIPAADFGGFADFAAVSDALSRVEMEIVSAGDSSH